MFSWLNEFMGILMKKFNLILIALGLMGFVSLSQATVLDSISTSASAIDNNSNEYGFSFTIEQHDALTYHATLLNTSDPNSTPEALIDTFAFNFDAYAPFHFTFDNVAPADWNIYYVAAGNIQFDYRGDANNPGTRLGAGDALTFDFVFEQAFIDSLTIDPFELWTGSDSSSCGVGLGGGEDCGQVAVSFQQIGVGGEDSDLLAANWTGEPTQVPEPGSALLLGLGLLGFGLSKKRKV